LISWRGITYVIFTIKDNQKIIKDRGIIKIISSSFEITIGRYLNVPVTMKQSEVKKQI